jgi:hypothetical protein
VPPIRWIADAMMILNDASAGIDWGRFVQLVATHRLSLPIYDGLAYLEKTFHAPVPVKILDNIRCIPITEIHRFGYRIMSDPIGKPTTGQILRTLWYEYLRLTSGSPLWKKPQMAVAWLQSKWSFDNRRQLVSILPYRALRHLWRRATERV